MAVQTLNQETSEKTSSLKRTGTYKPSLSNYLDHIQQTA